MSSKTTIWIQAYSTVVGGVAWKLQHCESGSFEGTNPIIATNQGDVETMVKTWLSTPDPEPEDATG